MRDLSIETSKAAIENIAHVGHRGLVTLKMENGIVQKVWCGTKDGLLIWDKGKTLVHLVPNVGPSLEHG